MLIKKIKVKGKIWTLQGCWDERYLLYLREDGIGRVIHKDVGKSKQSLYNQLKKDCGRIVYKDKAFTIFA